MRELLCFAWEGFASPVSISLGGGRLLLNEDTETKAIARLRERRPGSLVPYLGAVARQLNGSCLPLGITNSAPELLPVGVVRELYERVEWDGDEDVLSAEGLLDDFAGLAARARARRCLPPRRSLRAAIVRMEVLRDGDGPEAEADRRLLRDLHFALIYSEVPR